jgi:putative SOS response-associated peptidase YedK
MARRGTGGRGAAESLLAPYPFDAMICWPVSARVGNVRNNDSSLIKPVAPA